MDQKKSALLIGIDNYVNYQSLSVCVNDAEEMKAALSMGEYGFDIETLFDKGADRRSLREKMRSFFRKESDLYLFYFAGHGWVDDLGGYLVSVDGDEVDVGVDLAYLKSLIQLAPESSSVLVILDCCHSGMSSIRNDARQENVLRSQDIIDRVGNLNRGRVVIAACEEHQLAYESATIGHGIFTSHILRGLMGEASDNDGCVTATSLYNFVSSVMKDSVHQTPVFRGDMAGKLIIGNGFQPIASISGNTIEKILGDASNYLGEYQEYLAQEMRDVSHWRVKGYKACCQKLDELLKWCERKIANHHQLKTHLKFQETYKSILQKREMLCQLENGMVTLKGQVTKKLGSGTFGAVWKIENQRELSKPNVLAYKVYHYADLDERDKVKRFRRGYDAMCKLDHPYIVRVHDLTECPLGFYMDFIDGPNFRHFTGVFEHPREIVACLITIADTLWHSHKRGVVHRDVKPENIIMSLDEKQGRWLPNLTDFDLAWFSMASQVTAEGLGTLHYSAPEQQLNPTSTVSHAPTVDSYSFGQLCYFAITGTDPSPYDRDDNKRALEGRMRDGWFQEGAYKFVELYQRCTERKPSDRPGFEKIGDELLLIYQLLSDVSQNTQLRRDRFIEEIVFSMIGLSPQNNVGNNAFLTTLRKTRVGITVESHSQRSISLMYDFQAQEHPIIDGVETYDQLRRILLGKIDDAISGIPNVTKRNGNQSPFQVFITHKDIPLNLDGVFSSKKIINKVVDVIEGR